MVLARSRLRSLKHIQAKLADAIESKDGEGILDGLVLAERHPLCYQSCDPRSSRITLPEVKRGKILLATLGKAEEFIEAIEDSMRMSSIVALAKVEN